MPRFKDQAICLRLIDWSETSQIVALLTQAHGKVRGVAKGSKRMSPSSIARYSGGIELLTRGEIVGIIKPSSDLATLTEWDLQDPYPYLRTDLEAQRLAYYAADLCNAILADHDAHPQAFEELASFLKGLAEPAHREAELLHFQWGLLEDCGYRPELDRDVITGGELPGQQAAYTFDAIAGGFSGQSAAAAAGAPGASAAPVQTDRGNHRGAGPWRVRRETLEVLRHVAADPAAAMGMKPASIQRANRLLCVYARAILDRELPTMGIVLGRGAE